MAQLNSFLMGALVMGYATATLFFMRFWNKSHDRLFVFFAGAFFILAAHWVLLAFTREDNEFRPAFYWFRLVAFALIGLGILDKNRRRDG